MTPSDINLVQVAHSTIAGRDCDVFKLYVHVIFGYCIDTTIVRIMTLVENASNVSIIISGSRQTFDQFAPIDLARSDLERYYVVLLSAKCQLLPMPFNAKYMITASCRT